MDKVLIFDTTLRDGEQSLPSSLSVKEKIIIAQQLARLNVDVIEAGFPISSPGDFESVETIAREVKGPIICALGRTLIKDIESCWNAIKDAERPRIHTFIGTSTIHRKQKLRRDDDEIIRMAVDAVKFARNKCGDIEFSAEDTGRTEREFLYRIVEQVIDAGATTINLPDTVGYTYPEEFSSIIDGVFNNVPNIDKAVISVHCHNDLGLATANSLMAVKHGARQIECSINGLGERAGNCALEEVVMFLNVRSNSLKLDTHVDTTQIHATSKLVSRICNVPVQPNKAIVGSNAFAHSSGIHQDGILKARESYEIMTPASVGLKENKMNLTSRSGRHMVTHRLQSMGYTDAQIDMESFYPRFVALADKKGTVYDDDLEALVEFGHEIQETFVLDYLSVTAGSGTIATATVRLKNGDEVMQEAATGDGPVDATYNALERLTGIPMNVKDYKLNAVTGGRDAQGKVNIVAEHNGKNYHGTGVSTDIVEASARSYLNAVNRIAGWNNKKKIADSADKKVK